MAAFAKPVQSRSDQHMTLIFLNKVVIIGM